MKISTIVALLLILTSCQKNEIDSNENTVVEETEAIGNIYFLTAGSDFVAFDLDKEEEIFRKNIHSLGPGGSPFGGKSITDSGKVYFSSLKSLSCLDLKTGSILWYTRLDKSVGYNKSNLSANNYPVIADTIIYNISLNALGHAINAVHKQSGELIWTAELSRNMGFSGRYYGTPVIHKDKIYAFCPKEGSGRQNIHCYDRFSGKLIWEVTDYRHKLETNPVIYNNSTLLVFSTGNNYVYGYDLETGALKFENLFGGTPFGEDVYIAKGQMFTGGFATIDYEKQQINEIEVRDFMRRYFDDEFYSWSGGDVKKRYLQTKDTLWTWTSPYLDTLRYYFTLMQPNDYQLAQHNNFYITDKHVFILEAMLKYMNGRGNGKPEFLYNSIFVIDKNNGKTVKEVKLAPGDQNYINPYATALFSSPTPKRVYTYP